MKQGFLVLSGGLAAAAAIAAIVGVVRLARRERAAPARCPAGLVALGARCCGAGQTLVDGHCNGRPSACARGMSVVTGEYAGCVALERRIHYGGGELVLGPSDWEAQGLVKSERVHVAPFDLDRVEVTIHAWQACVAAGTCRALDSREPGLAVSDVAAAEAERYCHFVGGRLPTGNEWLFAAVGANGRRFPWGQTGLVCRRAAFGLVDGPCAHGATGPELAGTRPDGATPEGALDMAGNVAEWTAEPGGRFVARGGSYRSKMAAELECWAVEPSVRAAPYIGFRCAYDQGQEGK
jgi:formylglycine-generating enzyme required for sulfatase activity